MRRAERVRATSIAVLFGTLALGCLAPAPVSNELPVTDAPEDATTRDEATRGTPLAPRAAADLGVDAGAPPPTVDDASGPRVVMPGDREDGSVDLAIQQCHARNGGGPAAGRASSLARPIRWEHLIVGYVQTFEGGWLGPTSCHREETSPVAWMVRGDIRTAYEKAGGPSGRLGFPLDDEHDLTGNRRQNFERGFIEWDSTSSSYRPFFAP